MTTLPKDFREFIELLNKKKGTRVNINDDGEKIFVKPIPEDIAVEGRGMLGTRGKVLKALLADRKREAK